MVNEDLSSHLNMLFEVATKATSFYDLPDDLKITLINLTENATYKVEAPDGQRWALRVHRRGYHARDAIASELAWQQDLRNTGVVTTPKTVTGKNSELIQDISDGKSQAPHHVVLSEWEAGLEPGIGENLIVTFQQLGEIAARMHRHARHWQRPQWFQRHTWDFETSLGEANPHWGRWREGMGVDAQKQKLFGRAVDVISKRLNAYGKTRENFGLVHGDLRLANLLIDGATVKVLDFDDCGFGWFMSDAVTPVSFYEHEPQVLDLIEAWKYGYRKIAPISPRDEAEIPTFMMLRRLLLVAWLGSHADTELARSMGLEYSDQTVELCEHYLSKTNP